MEAKQAHKEAAKVSRKDGARYVVYVFDQGYDCYDREQARRYGPLINIEAAYVDGVKMADAEIANRLVAQ